jgi:tyrosyl-tRNA synthetase
MLDSLKSTPDMVESRAKYYQFTITAMLKSIGVSDKKLRFVLGSSYQKTPGYIMDIFRLSSLVSEHDAKRAGTEVVKQSQSAPLSSLMYPILQSLDEEYLGVDAQIGGTFQLNYISVQVPWLMTSGLDQRKLFIAAKEWLPKIGYKQVCPNLIIHFCTTFGTNSLFACSSSQSNGGRVVRWQNGTFHLHL